MLLCHVCAWMRPDDGRPAPIHFPRRCDRTLGDIATLRIRPDFVRPLRFPTNVPCTSTERAVSFSSSPRGMPSQRTPVALPIRRPITRGESSIRCSGKSRSEQCKCPCPPQLRAAHKVYNMTGYIETSARSSSAAAYVNDLNL